MSPEDEFHTPPLASTSARNDETCTNLEESSEPGSRSKRRNPDMSCSGDKGKSPLLKILSDAEFAAHSAAIQLISFKNVMDDDIDDSSVSAADKQQFARQRELLLDKLESFRRINKSLRLTLKHLQDAEADQIAADKQIEALLQRIEQAETANELLKRDLNETQRRYEEIMTLRQAEQENLKGVVHMTKSVEATRAHLQGQLRSKEAENNRLHVQLRTVERTVIEQRRDIEDLKGSVASVSEKAAQERELLKKATRAQKVRAQRLESAVEKCYTQLREKDVELASARRERRQQKEQLAEEKERLLAQTESLKSEIADLTARLQRKDEVTSVNETIMHRVEKLTSENRDLCVNNAALKTSVARLEQQLTDSEAALVEEKIVCQERKRRTDLYQCQVAELEAAIDSLRMTHSSLLQEMDNMRVDNDAKLQTVRQELQGRMQELKTFPKLLSAVEQSLFECRENLRHSKRKCSEKSQSLRQLQLKVESQTKLLRSSMDMKESIQEASFRQQEKVTSLQEDMDQLQQENLELAQKLAAQKDALSYSNRQLDQRSLECQALNRQLEAVLSDSRLQVGKVKHQADSRHEALQSKILELEAEINRKDNELRLLRQSKLIAEKQFEVRVKDLQLSLDQSESHKQSIQNYVDFLKNSYKSMFDEGSAAASSGSPFY